MSKYEPLAQFLQELDGDSWGTHFSEIERVLGFSLPKSAQLYPAWWANQEGGHSQTKGWRDAGWETCRVDLERKRVTFVRSSQKQRKNATKAAEPLESLIERAGEITRIDDRDELIRSAVSQLLQRHAANNLIALGGTAPNAAAPPRRRID